MKKSNVLFSVNSNLDYALLLLRIWLGTGLFVNHGWEKIAHFSEMSGRFPDPLLVGKTVGLVFALLSDTLCSIFVAVGLSTRIASVVVIINMAVAFFIFWHAALNKIDGELCFIYLGGYLVILMAGPGRYSVDALINESKKKY